MALQIKIQVVNVANGDAIIVYMHDEQRKLVILIDGGEKQYLARVLVELEAVLIEAQKEAPDLVICTHFDSDHIRGAAAIIKHYFDRQKEIGEVWIHAPQRSLIVDAQELNSAKKRRS